MCERWVGDGTDCHILTPSHSVHSSTSSLFFQAAQQGSSGPKLSFWCWFSLRLLVLKCDWNSNCDCNSNGTLPASNSNWPKSSLAPGYIIVLRAPASCGRLQRMQPRPKGKGDTPISSTGCTVIYIGAPLNWQLGRGPICYFWNKISPLLNHIWDNHQSVLTICIP